METRLVNREGTGAHGINMGQGHPCQNVPKVKNGLGNRKNLFSKCLN